MSYRIDKLFHLLKTAFPVFLIMFVLTSCSQTDEVSGDESALHIHIVDSLFAAGKTDSAIRLTRFELGRLAPSNPQVCNYYILLAEHSGDKPALMNLYADSAIAFFSTERISRQYPEIYLKALLTKGDACLKVQNYAAALSYYYYARKILAGGVRDDGTWASKVGSLYFEQKNYSLAARYWALSYNRIGQCGDKVSVQRLFYLKQGALNNTGFCYDLAGKADSASYYYLKDLALISRADSDKRIDKGNINSALGVVYDNLGGLTLKLGQFSAAAGYLNKCIALPQGKADGAKIPPLVKLAELYLKTGESEKAANAFSQSRALLTQFPKSGIRDEIKWNRLYADYLTGMNKPAEAFRYLEVYIKLRDSLDNRSADLYRLNVEKELTALQQKQSLNDLGQENKVKRIYLSGAFIFLMFATAIILMTRRVLKKTKENRSEITRHNTQLQQSLNELERVNKNYLRIMRVMAHDLRNPISGITGVAAMLISEDEFSEDSKNMLKLIETTGLHSMEMINELLKSGLADENEKLVKHNIDIKALLYDSVELLQFKANEKEQRIIFEHGDEPVMAEINHEKIWRVVNNLIVNAIKFSHNGSTIKVGVKLNEKKVVISIADNGIGIPDSERDSIFEMFTSAKKVGTNGEQPFGLGLSISKKIIEMHEGTIWFEKNPDGGTIFFIRLPANNI